MLQLSYPSPHDISVDDGEFGGFIVVVIHLFVFCGDGFSCVPAWLRTPHVAKDSLSVLQWGPVLYINVIIGTCLADGDLALNLRDRRAHYRHVLCLSLATRTKYHKLGNLKQQAFIYLFSALHEDWKPRIKLAASSSWGGLSSQAVTFSPHPNTGGRESTLSVLSLYGTNPISGPPSS